MKSISALGEVVTNEFDGLSRVVKSVRPEGNSVEYVYDSKNNVLTVTNKPKPGSPLADIVNSFTYHPTFNKVATATDGLGRVTTMAYDPVKGTLLTIQRPQVDGQTPQVSFTYSSRGQLLTRTDETGIVTQFNYDTATERLLSIVHDQGAGRLNLTTSFDHNSRGDVTSVTDPRGNVTLFTFDLERRRKQMTEVMSLAQKSPVTKWTYNANGNLTKIERKADEAETTWQTTNISYSVTDQPTVVLDPENKW